VPTVIEKVLLALCMAVLIGDILTNPFNLDKIQRTLIALTLFFLACFLAYTVYRLNQRKPNEDSKSVVETAAAPAPIDNSAAQFKVLPEISLEPYRSNTNRVLHPGIFLTYDALDMSSADHRLFFASKLRMRFDNQDTSLAAIRRVTVFLRREGDAGEVRESQLSAALIRDVATRARLDLDSFQIQPVAITPYYELDCDAELEKSWARLLDDHCFVRVKVEAVRQPPYCIDLNVDWETARLTNSVASVSLRRNGLCQEVKPQAEEPPLKNTELDKLEIKLLQILSWPKYEHDVEGLAGYVGQHVTRVEYHLERLEHDGYVCSSPVIIAGMKTTYSLTHKGREYVVKNNLLMV